jgi:hypothetical protein
MLEQRHAVLRNGHRSDVGGGVVGRHAAAASTVGGWDVSRSLVGSVF